MKQRGIGKQINGNLGNVFRRTALGMLFLYFVFASYYLLGIEAVVVTSFFFLLAQFSPFFLRMYDKHKGLLKAKRTKHSIEPNPERSESEAMPIRLSDRAEQESM
ncbi:MAG: hypothetical protein H6963_11255 [Chromatiaceae bacterium]|nr:hypothetical protein [Chromatiaceae bacterium]MCP5443294.1 hypothetical protein [Chromatiaceae bacterium]